MFCPDSHGKLFSIYFICRCCHSSSAVWQLKSLHIHVASWRYFTPTYINHKGRQKPRLDCKTRSQSHGDLWRPGHKHPPACNWEGEKRKRRCQRWPEQTGAHWDVSGHVQTHETSLTWIDQLKSHLFTICLRVAWNVLNPSWVSHWEKFHHNGTVLQPRIRLSSQATVEEQTTMILCCAIQVSGRPTFCQNHCLASSLLWAATHELDLQKTARSAGYEAATTDT